MRSWHLCGSHCHQQGSCNELVWVCPGLCPQSLDLAPVTPPPEKGYQGKKWCTRHAWPGFSIHGHLFFSFLKKWMPRSIRLKSCKRGSGSTGHTWIGHHRVTTLNLLEIFWKSFLICWKRLSAASRLSHHQYKILPKNVCNSGQKYMLQHCISVSKQYHGECIQIRANACRTAKGGWQNIKACDLLFDWAYQSCRLEWSCWLTDIDKSNTDSRWGLYLLISCCNHTQLDTTKSSTLGL